MRVKTLVATVCLVAALGTMWYGEKLEPGTVERAVFGLAWIPIGLFYLFIGSKAEGWLGASYRSLLEERARLHNTIEASRTPGGAELAHDARLLIDERLRKLERKIDAHPENPSPRFPH